IGCPDYPTPRNGWMKRIGDVTHIGCNDSTTEWSLRCVGGAWVGAAYNCTPLPDPRQSVPSDESVTRRRGSVKERRPLDWWLRMNREAFLLRPTTHTD
ncbi:hypothetical protein LSH36_953g00058, partial [Paralvinella palmiformis]